MTGVTVIDGVGKSFRCSLWKDDSVFRPAYIRTGQGPEYRERQP
uniref:Uncharacterized protein n=1 Tax=Salmonella sp. 14 TaxID=1179812 RepID=I3W302_9ENTR|nr:hypothetical protein [Salmonella sp. 14]